LGSEPAVRDRPRFPSLGPGKPLSVLGLRARYNGDQPLFGAPGQRMAAQRGVVEWAPVAERLAKPSNHRSRSAPTAPVVGGASASLLSDELSQFRRGTSLNKSCQIG